MTEDFSTPPSEPVEKEAENHLERIQTLEAELKECHDKHLRLLAEMENSRKRLMKEKQEMTRFGIENVITDFLSPMDNLENALKFAHQMSEETRNWARGFEMILCQFKEVLTEHGVASFTSVGQAFDPHMHEAVEVEETSTVPEGQITAEFVKGYKSAQRTLRPARVKVAKAPSPQEAAEETKKV
jgi:molecular chaperone GrpE